MTIGQISDTETAKNVKIVNVDPVHVQLTGTFGNEEQVLLTDDLAGALVTIDYAHHEIHEGDTYRVSYKSPDGSPVADDGTLTFAITTTTKTAHLTWDASGGGDIEIEMYEGSTTSGGVSLAPQNKNRTYPNANTVTFVRDPTVSVVGTMLGNLFAAGGTGPQAGGSVGGERDEWIFKKTTKYVIRVTNRSGNAKPLALRAEWYEE